MMGSLARKTMPINIDNWAQVPEDKKNFIWNTVLVRVLSVVFSTIHKMFVLFLISAFLLHATFEVDPKAKKKILSDAGRY